jgi:DNA-binding CsgD family transcriptional regulator/DNA-binding MarR family transcriptional regulator
VVVAVPAWWQEVGLPASAGQVLQHLVTHPESTPTAIADELDLTVATVDRTLRLLGGELLVVRVGRRPARWSASPPRAAMEALLQRRRAELANVELEAERMQEEYAAHLDRRFASDQFEVLDTPQRVTARYEHLLRSARREVLHLVMPPSVATSAHPDRMAAQAHAASLGVRFRAVYDVATFDGDLTLRTARAGLDFGGQVRLSKGLPMKLALFDDTAALMTISPDDPAAGSLVVYSPPLLRVLRALFEELWEHGAPWPATSIEADPPSDEPQANPRSVQVLRLMALGMKDDAIARVLGVSRRTVQQIVSDVGAELGARTRFQIALQAQAAGWLRDP